jgi:hypothetical protein
MLILFFYSILINHIFNLTNKNWVPWCTSVNSLTKPVFNVSTETNNFQEKLVRHKCVITQTYSFMCDGSFHMHCVHLGTVNAICSEYSQRNWTTLQSNLCSFLYYYNWKIYRLSFNVIFLLHDLFVFQKLNVDRIAVSVKLVRHHAKF